eukprot:429021-Prymnesium_polylepis.1
MSTRNSAAPRDRLGTAALPVQPGTTRPRRRARSLAPAIVLDDRRHPATVRCVAAARLRDAWLIYIALLGQESV